MLKHEKYMHTGTRKRNVSVTLYTMYIISGGSSQGGTPPPKYN